MLELSLVVRDIVTLNIPDNKLGVGMMVGDADTYWTVDESITNFKYIEAAYPGIHGGYLWEAGRASTADWADRVGPLLLREDEPNRSIEQLYNFTR